jgi:putative Holliday junction resolvase
MMNLRTLGIDFGERRIGLALSDPAGRMALPLCTIDRQTDRRAAYRIADLMRREDVRLLVIGEPLDLDGHATAASERARGFGRRLTRITGIPVRWVDESLTTVEATAKLREAGADRPTHRGRRDAIAAQILLQEALDHRREEAS